MPAAFLISHYGVQDEATTQTLRLTAILCSCLELVVVAGHKACPGRSREDVAASLQVLHSHKIALWYGSLASCCVGLQQLLGMPLPM